MHVKVSIDNGIATVTLDRPEKMNALNEEMYLEMARIFAALQTDDSVRAVILTGAGKAFCSGSDVGGMHSVDLRDRPREADVPVDVHAVARGAARDRDPDLDDRAADRRS